MVVFRLVAVVVTAVLLGSVTVPAQAEPTARHLTGTVSGSPFVVDVPANWNGTLLLWSHGYSDPSQPAPPPVPEDPLFTGWLRDHGYALAGSAFPNLPWASHDAIEDQLALLDWFTANVGKPRRTIAAGQSLGGQVTTVLAERHPHRFAAALPMCGPLAGGVAWLNGMLDIGFALKTLLWPDQQVQVARIANPAANQELANGLLRAALNTPAGSALVSRRRFRTPHRLQSRQRRCLSHVATSPARIASSRFSTLSA